jgi:hypothetical protein
VTDHRVPRPAPGIPTAALPPRSRQITLPGVPRPAIPELDAVTEIQRHPSRQDARSEATDTPIEPLGQRRERLPERQTERRTFTPPEFESPATQEAVAREVWRQGGRVEPVPGSIPSRMPPPPPSSLRPDAVDAKGIQVRWSTLKQAAPWVLAALGLTGGGGTGYFVGLRQARAEIAELQAAAEDHEKRLAKREKAAATLSKTVDAIDDSLRAEAQERRSDVGALGRRVDKLEENQPKIHGIVPR